MKNRTPYRNGISVMNKIIAVGSGRRTMMGKIKQLSIEKELPDVGSMYPTIRIYQINDILYSREEFIKEVALCIYDNEPQTNIRETIDLLLKDDMKELVCSGGKKFFSYLNSISLKSNGGTYDFDGDVVEKDMETPSRGLRRRVGIIEDPITGIEHDFEERPLKSYEVSYDVLVQALIKGITKKRVYKRVTEAIAATSFKEAKELVRKRTFKEGKTTKSYEVVEVKLTEVRDPSKWVKTILFITANVVD